MSYGICEYSVIAVRKEANNRSEMVTQLLFGHTYSILENKKGWAQIRISDDNYEGWIEEKQINQISEQEFKHLTSEHYQISTDLVQVITNLTTNSIFPILLGSHVYGEENKSFYLNKQEYQYDGAIASSAQQNNQAKVIENALMYHYAPYLWGGKTPFGIDCSGFVQMAYHLSGIKLLRDASQQATQGETINLISDATPADLCFFDNQDGDITHVGILLPDSKIIHASGCVRIDTIDHQGIFNSSTQTYSHKLRIIKKII